MMTTEERSETATETQAPAIDYKFELAVIPVSDVDRAKAFYASLGWRLDAEFEADENFHLLQFTPPGSPASVIVGKGVTPAAPGSVQGLYLIVSDIETARADLIRRGVAVSETFHGGAVFSGPDEPFLFGRTRVSGPDPARGSYRSFASFRDPDGNGWLLQEITARQPGRIDSHATGFASVADLAGAMRRASIAHGEHEARNGGAYDENWPDWYAAWMVAEQAGTALPD
jgi:catechol 2,3-dioxygenase-like lactoylglutathione lyase family enzyme